MTVTEIAILSLKPGTNVTDKSSNAGQVWDETGSILGRQEGMEGSYWGLQHENPNMLQLFVNWKKLENHTVDFMKSSDYQILLDRLGSLIDAPPNLVHYEFTDPAAQRVALTAPITECFTAHTESKSSTLMSNMEKFLEVAKKNADGFLGAAFAWSVEDVEHEKLGEGKKGKAFFAALGWQSLEAHMAFREHPAFKENIQLLRIDDIKAVEVHHVKTQNL